MLCGTMWVWRREREAGGGNLGGSTEDTGIDYIAVLHDLSGFDRSLFNARFFFSARQHLWDVVTRCVVFVIVFVLAQ